MTNGSQGDGSSASSPPKWQSFIFCVIGIAFMFCIFGGLFVDENIIRCLSSIENARGLITFIIATGTILIALLVVIGTLLSTDVPKERFYRAKEILTILVGVLGTIVGFYYGSQADSDNMEPSISITTPYISVLDKEMTMTAFVSGGEAPYEYEIKNPGPLDQDF